eukprot:jgi/Orpsp1_1/1174959/evm.model.c7180000052093.1
MIKLLIEYANKYNIILELNKENNKRCYPIFCAISLNNIDIIKLLIEYANEYNITLEINKKNNDGDYPLLYSVKLNNIKIVKLLMKYANTHRIIIKINEKNKFKKYPLDYAFINKNIKMLKLLIKYNIFNKKILNINDINIENIKIDDINDDIIDLVMNYEINNLINIKYIENGLFFRKKNEEIYKSNIINEYLRNYIEKNNNTELDKNIKLNNKNYYEWKIDNFSNIKNKECSPEFVLYEYNWKIKLNLINDESINIKLYNNIFSLLGENEYIKIICTFIIRNINEYSINKTSTVLKILDNKNSVIELNEIIKIEELLYMENNLNKSIIQNDSFIVGVYIILKKKKLKEIALNQYREDGETLLTYNCKNNNLKEIKKLIKNGADINLKNRDGDTPISISCKIGFRKIVNYLIKYGADINIKNNDGDTPIIIALYRKDISLIEYLYKNDADFNIINDDGESFISILKENQYSDIEKKIKYIFDKQRKDGETALTFICKRRSSKSIWNLIKL